MKTYVQRKTSSQMFIVTLFIVAKKWKQPICQSTDEWINKMWYSQTMEYYLDMKYNEVLMHATTWVDLEIIMQSEISQTQKATYYMVPFI